MAVFFICLVLWLEKGYSFYKINCTSASFGIASPALRIFSLYDPYHMLQLIRLTYIITWLKGLTTRFARFQVTTVHNLSKKYAKAVTYEIIKYFSWNYTRNIPFCFLYITFAAFYIDSRKWKLNCKNVFSETYKCKCKLLYGIKI